MGFVYFVEGRIGVFFFLRGKLDGEWLVNFWRRVQGF